METKEIDLIEIHKEIDLIQNCISRMANNSFLLKGWLITIYAVVLALLPEKANSLSLCLVMMVVTWAFWYLDGYFLRIEKIYRKIYDWVLLERPKGNRNQLYQLNPVRFKGKIEAVKSIPKVMFSNTLLLFYGIPMLIVIVIFLVNFLIDYKPNWVTF